MGHEEPAVDEVVATVLVRLPVRGEVSQRERMNRKGQAGVPDQTVAADMEDDRLARIEANEDMNQCEF